MCLYLQKHEFQVNRLELQWNSGWRSFCLCWKQALCFLQVLSLVTSLSGTMFVNFIHSYIHLLSLLFPELRLSESVEWINEWMQGILSKIRSNFAFFCLLKNIQRLPKWECFTLNTWTAEIIVHLQGKWHSEEWAPSKDHFRNEILIWIY